MISYFKKSLFLFLFVSSALYANCDCNPDVIGAYMPQMQKLKDYYAKLQDEINTLSEKTKQIQKKAIEIQSRRDSEVELLKLRKIASLNQKKYLNDIYSLPDVPTEAKTAIIKNELELFKPK